MCNMYMPGIHGSQKKAKDPLEPKLQVTVSCHVGIELRSSIQTVMLNTEPSLQLPRKDFYTVHLYFF